MVVTDPNGKYHPVENGASGLGAGGRGGGLNLQKSIGSLRLRHTMVAMQPGRPEGSGLNYGRGRHEWTHQQFTQVCDQGCTETAQQYIIQSKQKTT